MLSNGRAQSCCESYVRFLIPGVPVSCVRVRDSPSVDVSRVRGYGIRLACPACPVVCVRVRVGLVCRGVVPAWPVCSMCGCGWSPAVVSGVCGKGRGHVWCPLPFKVWVRRRATLPHPSGCSTIAVPGLSFRVRNGSGRLPWAMAAANLQLSSHRPSRPWGLVWWVGDRIVDATEGLIHVTCRGASLSSE